MIKTICDICGRELDEDYTRYHYTYSLNFDGVIPHQSTNYNGMSLATLVNYSKPTSWHLNLCEDCGPSMGELISNHITLYSKKEEDKENKKKEDSINLEVISNLFDSIKYEKKYGKTNNYINLTLMNMEEWKRNHSNSNNKDGQS